MNVADHRPLAIGDRGVLDDRRVAGAVVGVVIRSRDGIPVGHLQHAGAVGLAQRDRPAEVGRGRTGLRQQHAFPARLGVGLDGDRGGLDLAVVGIQITVDHLDGGHVGAAVLGLIQGDRSLGGAGDHLRGDRQRERLRSLRHVVPVDLDGPQARLGAVHHDLLDVVDVILLRTHRRGAGIAHPAERPGVMSGA